MVNITQKKIDGKVLLKVKSPEELADLCEISAATSEKIFGIVKETKENDYAMKISKMRIQAESCSTPKAKSYAFIEKYKTIRSDFYETLEESLESAGFENIDSMMKFSKEIAVHLDKEEVLEDFKITQSDAMALAIYTYDNGEEELENFEKNPYRIVNKSLNEQNEYDLVDLKGYILRLIAALRKLPAYDKTKTLYRAVTNIGDDYKKVGNTLNWPAFTSTSSDENSVIDFFNNIAVDGDRYIFEITGCFKKGHNIRDFSFLQGEDGKQF